MSKVNGGDESRDWEGEVEGEVEPDLGYRKKSCGNLPCCELI